MNGSRGEKPFEATHARLQKARREGDVARSPEFAGAVAFAAAVSGTALIVPLLGAVLRAELIAQTAQRMPLTAFLPQIAACALVPATCAAAGAVAGAMVQGGLHVRGVQVQLQRLNPLAGLQRICSRDTAIAALRAVAVATCSLLGAAAAFAGAPAAFAGAHTAPQLAGLVWHAVLLCAFAAAVLGLLSGFGDMALAFAAWRKRLRMTFDELKREHKEQDGDPAAKGRRRTLHRELSRSSLRRLKEAAFVVVNPSHIAVALAYAPPRTAVPRVLLRAADEAALRVRHAATGLRIPVVENVPLARELYASSKAGDVIPRATYVAVAQVVASLVKAGVLR